MGLWLRLSTHVTWSCHSGLRSGQYHSAEDYGGAGLIISAQPESREGSGKTYPCSDPVPPAGPHLLPSISISHSATTSMSSSLTWMSYSLIRLAALQPTHPSAPQLGTKASTWELWKGAGELNSQVLHWLKTLGLHMMWVLLCTFCSDRCILSRSLIHKTIVF